MQMTLPSGLTLTGTASEMQEFLQATIENESVEEVTYTPRTSRDLYPDTETRTRPSVGLYNSDTKGWVHITSMHTLHIKNAVLKLNRDHEAALYRREEFENLVTELCWRLYGYEQPDTDAN